MVTWLGVAYSVADFVEVLLQHNIVDRVLTFTSFVDPNLGYNAVEWADWFRQRFNQQLPAAIRAHEEKQRNAELARVAQAKADTQRETYGYGKGSRPYSGSGGRYYR